MEFTDTLNGRGPPLPSHLILMGFVLLAANTPDGSLRIADAADALQTAPSRYVILLLLIAGFGMKIALLPMHFWMPLSYTASPIPAAAVLSGAAVKAGVIGLIRFLPFGMALPGWGELLTIVGFCGAFYGVGVGITQNNPKTVLAYSSVSQMGFLAAVLGMGLAAGDKSVEPLVAFCAAHHVLVKGALFLAVGVAALTASQRIGVVVLPGAVIALGLAGLPLTGGALAKLAVKDPLGYGVAGTLASLSASGTTLLMLHFLHRLVLTAGREPGRAGGGQTRRALAGYGSRFHRGPLDNVSSWGIRFSLRRTCSGSALEGAMADSARRGAGCRAVALGSQPPAHPGRGCRGRKRVCSARRSRRRSGARAVGQLPSAVGGRESIASGGGPPLGCSNAHCQSEDVPGMNASEIASEESRERHGEGDRRVQSRGSGRRSKAVRSANAAVGWRAGGIIFLKSNRGISILGSEERALPGRLPARLRPSP